MSRGVGGELGGRDRQTDVAKANSSVAMPGGCCLGYWENGADRYRDRVKENEILAWNLFLKCQ